MPRQSDMKFVFTSASSVPFDVIKFNLKEGISECFELRLDLVSINPSVDFGQILDRPALLTIWHGDMPVRYVHGIVTAFVQGDTGFRRTRYSVLIEPSLKRAEFCSDWRITRQRTIPQLLQQLINEQGISDYEQRLYGTHLPREYCVTAGQKLLANAGQGIGLFAHGGEFRQVAHQGDLSLQAQQATVSVKYVLPRDPEQMARENRMLDDFIAGGDGIDPLGKS
ncbi:MAG: contractile injection system protein, VgrG/Pvc8 family [Paraburkholderia tropica]|nr:contractile injection system protein, VgrG/Pvc8 family [Paraburkholderia tropica]